MAKMKQQRRARYDGGLYKKTQKVTDPETGDVLRTVTYWQASRELRPEELPRGVERKRITGSGPTASKAKERLDQNYRRFISPEAQGARKQRGHPLLTVQEFFELWRDECLSAGKVSDTMARRHERTWELHILPYFGSRKFEQITTDELTDHFHDTLLTKTKEVQLPSGVTINQSLLSTTATRNIYMSMRSAITWGISKDYLAFSPLKGVDAPLRNQVEFNIEDAIASTHTLLAALTRESIADHARFLFQLMGLRRSERLGLTWSNIHGLETDLPVMTVKQQLARYVDGRGWYIKGSTKTGQVREIVIPIEPFGRILRQHKEEQDRKKQNLELIPRPGFEDLVFLQPHGDFYSPNRDNQDWHNLLERNGLPYFRAHLTRHVTATLLGEVEPAVPIATVQSILGHQSTAMAFYYQHMTKKAQATPMALYGQSIAEATRGDAKRT